MQRSPLWEVEAVVRTSGELLSMVEDHEIDFAIAVTNRVPEGLSSKDIYSDSIVAVVPKGSGFQRGGIRLEELSGKPLILYPASSHSRMLIDDLFRASGVVPTVAMEMHYPEAICSLVKQGMGIGLISELSARESKLKGQVAIPVRELRGARRIGVVTHRRRRLTPQAKVLMETIRERV